MRGECSSDCSDTMSICTTRLIYSFHQPSQVRFLDRHCASQNQYIRIQHKDGRIEHVKGPVELFCNPVKHESMKVKDAVELGVTDVVMIHSDRPSQKEIEPMCAGGEVGETRTLDASVVRGPAMFFPCANQRILELTWRTSDVDARQISKLSMASHTLILSGTFPLSHTPVYWNHANSPQHVL